MTIPAPWERHDPTPIPEPCTATVLRLLPQAEFEALLRSNLVPGSDRLGFQELWMLLAFNDDLAHRCFDVLEDWLDRADQLLLVDPESPRSRKFRRMCDDAWNRLTKARDVDVKPEHDTPAPHTTAGQFALGIAEHRARLTHPTDLDDALWAALTHARDRARRSRETTKAWQSAPVLTTQLIDAVAEHRRLNPDRRPADNELYGLLRC